MKPSFIRQATLAIASSLVLGWAPAGAAPDAAAAYETGDMPMADYLDLLARIAPAAQQGAQAYLEAFRQRCGRPLQTIELRRALSDGEGDPVLMAMIRASHLGDKASLGPLGQRISCERGPAR